MNRRCFHVIVLSCALPLGSLVAACGGDDGIRPDMDGEEEASLGYFVLIDEPTPATVLNSIDQTYRFPNNLTNSIWQRQAEVIVTGEYSEEGYWAFPPTTSTYPDTPDNGTDIHARMVQVPETNTVLYTRHSRSSSDDGVGVGDVDQLAVATIDTISGLLSEGEPAELSDSFTGSCQLTSAAATEFLCYDGTVIRRYLTAEGSTTLTANGTLPLSDPLPEAAECNPGEPCYGSTFAFDGAYYYFAADQGSSSSLAYVVYDTNGTYVNTYTASGTGAINGVYFDWSVGRYSTHDGYGIRAGPSTYGESAWSDTHNFGPVSSTHELQ